MEMIEKSNPELSISQQCAVLEISRSSLYYSPAPESEINLEIMQILDKQYFKTPFYGLRKLTVLLQSMGYAVNKKRVHRLMNLVNWQTIYREPKTTFADPNHQKYPYLLRNLEITRNNQVWATDITYIPMAKGFMYLMAIIDLNSRYVLNWGVSNTMTAQWCADILDQTLQIFPKPEIFNTDQGVQYTSDVFTNMLKTNDIQISMDGKGRALDNIFIERLWRSVKYEHIYLYIYENGLDLHIGLRAYFEFYNNDRFHEAIGYDRPKHRYFKPA